MIFSEMKEKNSNEYNDNNLYKIQSLTKPITSLVALIILNKFNIDVNEPIQNFISNFSNQKVLKNGDLENSNKDITFHHLLTHTSGITYGFRKSNQSILRGNTEADEEYRKVEILARIQNPNMTSDEFINNISSLPLAYHPGTRWNYGMSSDVLGVLLEKICNKPLNIIFKEELFDLLEMNNTHFAKKDLNNLFPTFKLTIPTGFKIIKDSNIIKYENKFKSGGGGLISTPEDYHKFCNFILNPNMTILNTKLVDMIKTNQIGTDLSYLSDGLNFYDFTYAGPGIGFTAGFSIIENPKLMSFKSPEKILSWAGSSNTIMWIDQKNNFVFSMFSQLIPFGYHNYKKELMDLIYSDNNLL
jgi:CubicO group peptidase (beta-lactamase class C family)